MESPMRSLGNLLHDVSHRSTAALRVRARLLANPPFGWHLGDPVRDPAHIHDEEFLPADCQRSYLPPSARLYGPKRTASSLME